MPRLGESRYDAKVFAVFASLQRVEGSTTRPKSFTISLKTSLVICTFTADHNIKDLLHLFLMHELKEVVNALLPQVTP
jgi:hypothetical protein